MSDETPPARPKPGSLRDRIAAFEKSNTGPTPAPAPVPRPKPGNLSWKPRAPSPTPTADQPNAPSGDQPEGSPRKAVGMSASDAKESIRGGSLKERMAALQGKGGFGGAVPTSPPPPKPLSEKPKWKPPPRVVSPPVDLQEERAPTPSQQERKATPDVDRFASEDQGDTTSAPSAGQPAEASEAAPQDDQDEEKQRRAAIAARMARLGGARVGMGTPIFGPKPTVKPPPPPADVPPAPEEEASAQPAAKVPVTQESEPPSQPTPSVVTSDAGPTEPTQEQGFFAVTPQLPTSDPSGLLSPDAAQEQAAHAPRAPTSMPVPAIPRRTAPPRKRGAKSPAPSAEPPKEPVAAESTEVPTETVETPDIQATPALEKSPSTEPAPSSDSGPSGDRVDEQAEDAEPQPQAGQLGSSTEPVSDAHKDDDDDDDDVEVLPSQDEASVASAEVPSHQPAPSVTQPDEPAPVVGDTTPPFLAENMEPTQIHEGAENEATSVPAEEPEAPAPEKAEEEQEDVKVDPAPQPQESFTPDPPVPEPEVEEEPAGLEQDAAAATAEEEGEQEEDEATRRQRVAQRLAKLGGFNPLAAHHTSSVADRNASRRSSHASVDAPLASPPAILRRGSVASVTSISGGPARRGSVDSSIALTREPEEDEQMLDNPRVGQSEEGSPKVGRRFSTQSTRSIPRSSTGSPAQARQVRRDSVDSERSQHARTESPVQRTLHYRATEISLPDEDERAAKILQATQPPHYQSLSDRPARTNDTGPPTRAETIPDLGDERGAEEEEEEKYEDAEEYDQDDAQGDSDNHEEQQVEVEEEEEEQVRRQVPSSPPPPIPKHTRPPSHTFSPPEVTGTTPRSPPATSSFRASMSPTPPARQPPPQPPVDDEPLEQEILDDEEGDPIDPKFISPKRSEFQSEQLHSPPPPPAPQQTAEYEPESAPPAQGVQEEDEEEQEEDPEQARRRALAERMAKLGGIRFGAVPPVLPGRLAPPAPRQAPSEEQEQGSGARGQEAEQPAEEEDEFARKQRIAAKLASMGGMRIGMLPPAVPPPVRKASVPVVRQEEEVESHQPEEQQAAGSSEYVQYDAEADQPEEAGEQEEYYAEGHDETGYVAEDVQEEPEAYEEPEEEAPPVPSRAGRRVSDNNRRVSLSPPPPPARGVRPPIPATPSLIPSRKTSLAQPQSESISQPVSSPGFGRYEDEPEAEEEETPPPPPPRPTRPPPPPVAAAPSSPPPPPSQAASSQWALPSIPKASIDFGDAVDLSLSSFQDSPIVPAKEEDPPAPPPRTEHPPRASIPPPAPVPIPAPAVERNYSPDELMAIWGKIGVQVLNSATELFEQSKRSVVGDGSYAGFVQNVLAQVPDILPPAYETGSWGYLIYAQTGSAVQRRAAEILPGDVITLSDAKFKGHKGLQSYQLSVGVEEPVIGVVNEVETKKMKLKVFQANQHVGQQTVESVSYRLEDLKSGSVKMFRILSMSM